MALVVPNTRIWSTEYVRANAAPKILYVVKRAIVKTELARIGDEI